MTQMLVNDEWVNALSGKIYEVKNPANGEVIDTVPLGDVGDARAAVDAAVAAFGEWASTAPDKRAELMQAGIAKVRENLPELTALLTKEQGKPLMEANVSCTTFCTAWNFTPAWPAKFAGRWLLCRRP
jgi:succinate-semialdehyde dehydrogenase/glutarate-semialdehyde dehydrogenase